MLIGVSGESLSLKRGRNIYQSPLALLLSTMSMFDLGSLVTAEDFLLVSSDLAVHSSVAILSAAVCYGMWLWIYIVCPTDCS